MKRISVTRYQYTPDELTRRARLQVAAHSLDQHDLIELGSALGLITGDDNQHYVAAQPLSIGSDFEPVFS